MSNPNETSVEMFNYSPHNYPPVTGASTYAPATAPVSSNSNSFGKTNDISVGPTDMYQKSPPKQKCCCQKSGKWCGADDKHVTRAIGIISAYMLLVMLVAILGFIMPFGIIYDAQQDTINYNAKFSPGGLCIVASIHVEQQVCRGYTCYAKLVTFNYTSSTSSAELVWLAGKTYDSSQAIVEQNLKTQWPVGTTINPCFYYNDNYYGMQIKNSLTVPYSDSAITYAWVSLGIGVFLIVSVTSFWIFAGLRYGCFN